MDLISDVNFPYRAPGCLHGTWASDILIVILIDLPQFEILELIPVRDFDDYSNSTLQFYPYTLPRYTQVIVCIRPFASMHLFCGS